MMHTSFYCAEKEELNLFLKEAAPLAKFVYYSGYLESHLLGRALGGEIYEKATKGIVYLVRQRSVQHQGFDYICIKASRPPVFKLVPLSDQKKAELTRVREVRHYASRQRQSAS